MKHFHNRRKLNVSLPALCLVLLLIGLSVQYSYAGDLADKEANKHPEVHWPVAYHVNMPSEHHFEFIPSTRGFEIDGLTTLNLTSTLIDRYLKHALTSLRLIASSPATRSGIWPEIRPGLSTLKEAIPGAALYIEPDGGYYSVDKGYTGLDLSDRDYFNLLFRGKEIHGSLIYSRSTGKQSLLMAVPVFEGSEVTGAVALSIFLDDFQRLISESLNLDDQYLWYVIDEKGNTVLHPRADFIFMKPAEQGGASLREAVRVITDNPQGYTSYQFAGRHTQILFTKTSFNDWRVVLGKIGHKVDDHYMPEAYELLEKLQEILSEALKDMDQSLNELTLDFRGQIPAEHHVRNAFNQLYKKHPFVISSALIDENGLIKYIEPADFYSSEGMSVRNQENYFVMQKNKAPLLSSSFLAVEGFDAVSLQYPIIDNNGQFHGSISLLLRPGVMVEELIAPHVAETIYEPWVMEPEGRIIFDKALDGTGKMLFLDYRHQELLELLEIGDKIANNPTGQGDYVFQKSETDEKMVRMAIWNTISLHGTEWRLVLSYAPYE